MRCLTLANALQEKGWTCAFASTDESQETVPALKNSGFSTVTPETALAGQTKYDVILFDHYFLSAPDEQKFKAIATHIFVIDDLADRPHICDALLDQTFGRTSDDYKDLIPTGTPVYTGSRYALLRPQFNKQRADSLTRREKLGGVVNRILVLISGSDPDSVTIRVLKSLTSLKTMPAIDVVLPSGGDNHAKAEEIRKQHPDKITLHRNVIDMASLMSAADLCIGAGGTASWERCCLGLPTALIQIADNQKFVARNLEAAGAIKFLGLQETLTTQSIAASIEHLINTPAEITSMSQKSAALCDGLGAQRIADIIDGILAISLRPLRKEDSDTLYQWQSEPDARRYSRNPAAPTLAEHKNWMDSFLKRTESFGYIVSDGTQPAGFVRIDPAKDGYEVSILIGTASRGKGIALRALNLLAAAHPEKPLKAYIYPENTASLALFRHAGYVKGGENWFTKAPLDSLEFRRASL